MSNKANLNEEIIGLVDWLNIGIIEKYLEYVNC